MPNTYCDHRLSHAGISYIKASHRGSCTLDAKNRECGITGNTYTALPVLIKRITLNYLELRGELYVKRRRATKQVDQDRDFSQHTGQTNGF